MSARDLLLLCRNFVHYKDCARESAYFARKVILAESALPAWTITGVITSERTTYATVCGAEAKRLRLRLQILRPQPSASSRPEERVSGAIITREQICVWRAASSGELTRFVGPVCARSIVSGAELFKSCLGRNGRLSSRCLVAAKSKC